MNGSHPDDDAQGSIAPQPPTFVAFRTSSVASGYALVLERTA